MHSRGGEQVQRGQKKHRKKKKWKEKFKLSFLAKLNL